MKKTNISGSNDQRKVNPEWFTAKTWMKVLSEKIQTKDQDIYHVHFEKGSRTKLHEHDGNQILIVTSGQGSLELFKKMGNSKNEFKIKKIQTIPLKEGDIVHIPKKILHTHGSTRKNIKFSHLAVNLLSKNKKTYKTIWYESDFKKQVTKII
jgi:quercetin dioxygenase-like cupin family protein